MLLPDSEAGEGTGRAPLRPGLHRDDGGYTLGHREGDAGHHYGTVAPGMRAARHLLTGRAFPLPGWKDRAMLVPGPVS
jgi:hypothetical protein